MLSLHLPSLVSLSLRQTIKTSGKKTECKAIIALIDSKMEALGFTRTLMNPVPNEEDATVYRMVARYGAIVSKNKTIYRR